MTLSINAPEELQLGVDYTVDYEANDDDVYFTFTPAESGFYTFVNSYSVSFSLNGERVDPVTNMNYGDNNLCVVYLEAGQKYLLDFYCYWSGEYTIRGDRLANTLELGVETSAAHEEGYKYIAEVTIEEAGYY